RLERSHCVCRAEHRGPAAGDRHWRLAFETTLRHGLFPDCAGRVAAWRDGKAAARQAIHSGRRARTTLLLRIGLGRQHRTAGVVAAVEDSASDARRRRAEAHHLPRHPRVRREPRTAWLVAAYSPDRPG